MELVEYFDTSGDSPFGSWFAALAAQSAAKVAAALAKLEQGNVSNLKGVGAGVLEIQAIAFISAAMEMRWLFSWPAAQRDGSKRI